MVKEVGVFLVRLNAKEQQSRYTDGNVYDATKHPYYKTQMCWSIERFGKC